MIVFVLSSVSIVFVLFIALCLGKKEENEQQSDDIELQRAGSSELKTHQTIKLTEIEILRRIGRGHYGEVYQGLWLKSVEVALKYVHTQTDFVSELSILSQLRHPNVVSVYGYFEDETSHKTFITMELAPKGSLRDFLQTEEGKVLSQKQLVKMAEDIASGMLYLHSKNVLHRDLAARNVLVFGNVGDYTLKITDFGMASIVDQSSVTAFAIKWTAPEVVEERKFSTKSDVWSFGVTVWELYMFGIEPYSRLNNTDITRSLLQNPLPKPNPCPNQVYQLLLKCWEMDPETRPNFGELKRELDDIHEKTAGTFSSSFSQNAPLLVPKELGTQDQCKAIGWCGPIDRPEAEKMLQNTPIGTFLFRYSSKKKSFVLSARTKDGSGYLHIAEIYANQDGSGITVTTTKGKLNYKTVLDYLAAMKKAKVITNSIHESVVEMPSVYMNHVSLEEPEIVYVDAKSQQEAADKIIYSNRPKMDENTVYVNHNNNHSASNNNNNNKHSSEDRNSRDSGEIYVNEPEVIRYMNQADIRHDNETVYVNNLSKTDHKEPVQYQNDDAIYVSNESP